MHLTVYCRELAPGTVSLTGDRAKGDDSKQDSHYNHRDTTPVLCVCVVKAAYSATFIKTD